MKYFLPHCCHVVLEAGWSNTSSFCQQAGLAGVSVQGGNTGGENHSVSQYTLSVLNPHMWYPNHSDWVTWLELLIQAVASGGVGSGRKGLTLTFVLFQAMALDDIKTHHWCIIGCSAVTGENLLMGVDWLLDDIAARIFTTE